MINIDRKQYDNAEAGGSDGFAKLKPGLYTVKITAVENHPEDPQKPYLQVSYDIDGKSELKGYFQKLKDATGKWYGNFRMYYGPKSLKIFKGNITAIEECNGSYSLEKADFDEQTLVGKCVVGVFREREYVAKDGTVKTSVNLDRLHSFKWASAHVHDDFSKVYTLEDQGKKRPEATKPVEGVEGNDDDLPF